MRQNPIFLIACAYSPPRGRDGMHPVGTAFAQQFDRMIVTAREREQSLEDVGMLGDGPRRRRNRSRSTAKVSSIFSSSANLAVAEASGCERQSNFTLRGVRPE